MTYPEQTEFFVPGTPAPQGSKAISRSGRMYETNKATRPWRKAVATAAAEHDPYGDTPLAVGLRFVFTPPKRPKFPDMAVKPDLDKLIRAVGDALTASGLIHDDARITALHATKEYGDTPGVHITIRSTQ